MNDHHLVGIVAHEGSRFAVHRWPRERASRTVSLRLATGDACEVIAFLDAGAARDLARLLFDASGANRRGER